jgi:alanyl aminopeptidase
MFESWLGEDPFRKGVQAYLKKHSWGNATAADFLAALGAAAGRDVATPFSTFLEQSGVPVVTAKLSCATGAPWLLLSQRAYRPIGSQADASKSWQIPVCVEHAAAPGKRQCTLLGGAGTELALERAASCPAWLQANDEAAGYYRVAYQGDLLDGLLKDGGRQLGIPERVALLQDLTALVRSGDVAADRALAVVPRMLQDPNRHLVSATSALLFGVARTNVVPEAARPKLARFVRESYGERARALGFRARPGEDEDTRLLRASLVGRVATAGEDKALGAEAVELARRWLGDPKAIEPDMLEVVLTAAGQHGDRSLFEGYREAAKNEKDRLRRQRMLGLLGSFRDPEIVKDALRIPLDPAFEPREANGVFFSALAEPRTSELAWGFFKQNYDALVARTPAEAQASLVFAASGFCDARAKADVEAFFKPRVAEVVGGPRNLARVLETIDLCIAFKEAQQANVVKFLERY